MPKVKILVVEDNIIIAEELELRLESLGYEVCGIAVRGADALKFSDEQKPDLVLMDIVLNDGMDGIETAKIINEKFHIPVIYLSAYSDDETISKAKVTNPYGYIIKPFNEVILKSNIEIALHKFELENKLRESKSLLAATLSGLEEAVFTTDRFGKLIFMNLAAEKLSGCSAAECKNKSITELFSISNKSSGQTFEDIFISALQHGKGIHNCNEHVFNSKQGRRHHIEFSVSPIKDLYGNVTLAVLVIQDISARKETELALIEAKNKAELANRIKSEFLAQMSHEIRTPINAMLSFASLIREEVKEQVDDEIKDHFDILDNAGRRMARTIDLLLNMSELQSGSYKTKFEKIDLYKDIIENVYLKYAQKAFIKNLEFNISKLTSNFEAEVDLNAAWQTITSLVDNAIKYTKAGGIEIRISRNNRNRLIIEVIDSGIGISDEYKKSLFKPFTQEDHGYTRRFEGTGLGLALAKKYCEVNTAELEVESEKSIGSTFRVVF